MSDIAATLHNQMAQAAQELDALKEALAAEDTAVASITEDRDTVYGEYQFALFSVADHKVFSVDYLRARGHEVPRRPAKDKEPVAEQIIPETTEALAEYAENSLGALDQMRAKVAEADKSVSDAIASRDSAFGAYQERIIYILDEVKLYTPEVLETLGHTKARRGRGRK